MFSDSALKSCIYYPVCRYQRTSGPGLFSVHKKNSIFLRRSLSSGTARRLTDRSRRDKIEFQFAVPNSGQNQFLCLATRESRFRRAGKVFSQLKPSTAKMHFFKEILRLSRTHLGRGRQSIRFRHGKRAKSPSTATSATSTRPAAQDAAPAAIRGERLHRFGEAAGSGRAHYGRG